MEEHVSRVRSQTGSPTQGVERGTVPTWTSRRAAARLVTLESPRTLWGEATAALVRGTLDSIHGGSFYGLGGWNFGERVALRSEYLQRISGSRREKKSRFKIGFIMQISKSLRWCTANPFSPAEQSIAKVSSWLRKGVDSVDAEQSLGRGGDREIRRKCRRSDSLWSGQSDHGPSGKYAAWPTSAERSRPCRPSEEGASALEDRELCVQSIQHDDELKLLGPCERLLLAPAQLRGGL